MIILRRIKKFQTFSQTFIRTFYKDLQAADLPTPKIQVKNAKYLAGSDCEKFPEFISTHDHESLKIIKVDENVDNAKKRAAEYVVNNINDFPGIIIKGLSIKNADDLGEFTKHLPYEHMKYESGVGYRTEVSSNIYTASEEPDNLNIELHNEMSYLDVSPSKLMFCCIEEAAIGGETPIGFNRDMIRDIDPSIYEKFIKKKIMYTRNLLDKSRSNYLSWQHTFKTDDMKEAENIMRRNNITWEWMDNGDLCIYNICEAIREHPRTKETVWFNQATPMHFTYYSSHPNYEGQSLSRRQYPFHALYGDGEEFEEETVNHLREVHWKNAIPIKLEQGNILFVDNFLCQHARMAFKGNRKILVNIFV